MECGISCTLGRGRNNLWLDILLPCFLLIVPDIHRSLSHPCRRMNVGLCKLSVLGSELKASVLLIKTRTASNRSCLGQMTESMILSPPLSCWNLEKHFQLPFWRLFCQVSGKCFMSKHPSFPSVGKEKAQLTCMFVVTQRRLNTPSNKMLSLQKWNWAFILWRLLYPFVKKEAQSAAVE